MSSTAMEEDCPDGQLAPLGSSLQLRLCAGHYLQVLGAIDAAADVEYEVGGPIHQSAAA